MVGITLYKTLHAALATLSNPEVGEVTEDHGLVSGIHIGHLVGNVYGIAEERVGLVLAQGINPNRFAVIKTELFELDLGILRKDENGVLAVRLLDREDKIDEVIKGKVGCVVDNFAHFCLIDDAHGLAVSVTGEERGFLCLGNGVDERLMYASLAEEAIFRVLETLKYRKTLLPVKVGVLFYR